MRFDVQWMGLIYSCRRSQEAKALMKELNVLLLNRE